MPLTNANIGTSSSKQKEASKSKLELDNTPEPNFDLLGSEDDLGVNDNSQESDSGQVQQSQSLIGGKGSEIRTQGKEGRSLISQMADRGNCFFLFALRACQIYAFVLLSCCCIDYSVLIGRDDIQL